MKNAYELQAIGCAVSWSEEDCMYIKNDLGEMESISISELFHMAGGEVSKWPEVWGDFSKYQQQTGRQCPRAYRIKVRLEIEEVSDEESELFWRKRHG